jgi:hypothetical protein
MMMESAFNLEVDIGNLGLDEQPEVCNSGRTLHSTDLLSRPENPKKSHRNLSGTGA